MHFTVCAQCNVIMISEFVYIKLTFSTLLLTKGSNSSLAALDQELVSRSKVATLSSNCKDKFRMIVSLTVSNFVKIVRY